MSTFLHVVDAFTNVPFRGNPAAVCVLETESDPSWMQLVAREMNLSETAFLHSIDGGFSLRWFTPTAEVNLCGHATLASAHILWATNILARNEVARFLTKSGWLTAKSDGSWIEMDFPIDVPQLCEIPANLADVFPCELQSIQRGREDYLIELTDEKTVRELRPNFTMLGELDARGVIVTARGNEVDFVSRFFAPAAGINEDPVTGSAHCTLAPFWKSKLGKSQLVAHQVSERGGVIHITIDGDRVLLRGQCVSISRVELF